MALEAKRTIEPQDVEVAAAAHRLAGVLSVPEGAQGLVLFAHGSGSGRHSPRNQFVASVLQEAGMATLLLDLLEPREAEQQEKVFNIELLAERLEASSDWAHQQPPVQQFRQGLFGASTGAAAALVAASRRPREIAAVVSRGGRPDLAWDQLPEVRAPTLLIVGGNDEVVLRLNRDALALLDCTKEMIVIPGATHLFPEPGALEEVAQLAAQWFQRHLG